MNKHDEYQAYDKKSNEIIHIPSNHTRKKYPTFFEECPVPFAIIENSITSSIDSKNIMIDFFTTMFCVFPLKNPTERKPKAWKATVSIMYEWQNQNRLAQEQKDQIESSQKNWYERISAPKASIPAKKKRRYFPQSVPDAVDQKREPQ